MPLPLITIGGVEMYDCATIVAPDRYQRSRTDALVLHHTAGAQRFDSRDAEIAHIIAINEQHLAAGYGGFGYNAIAFETGALYVVGNGNGARAHVAGLNGILEGVVMAGNYDVAPVPIGITLAVGRWLLAKYRQRGLLSFNAHRDYNPFIPPYYRSVCPGGWGYASRENMLHVTAALNMAGG